MFPLIPFVEVIGKGASASPEQIAETAANVGVTTASMVTEVVAVTSEQPAVAGMV